MWSFLHFLSAPIAFVVSLFLVWTSQRFSLVDFFSFFFKTPARINRLRKTIGQQMTWTVRAMLVVYRLTAQRLATPVLISPMTFDVAQATMSQIHNTLPIDSLFGRLTHNAPASRSKLQTTACCLRKRPGTKCDGYVLRQAMCDCVDLQRNAFCFSKL